MFNRAGLHDTIKALLEECIAHDISAKLLHCWAPVKLWYDACNSIMPKSPLGPSLFEEPGGLTEKNFNYCLSRHVAYRQTLESFDVITNETGIYKINLDRDMIAQLGYHRPFS
jgi:hypothetical protein